MARNAEDVSRQSPIATSGPEGSDLRSVANRIEGLLDDSGDFNPDGRVSRNHPDYDPATDPRETKSNDDRDERGRFKSQKDAAEATEESEDLDLNEALQDDQGAAGEDLPEDTEQEQEQEAAPGDTDEDQTASADEEAKTEEADTDTIQSLSELASALEVPIEELKETITHTFRAADEDVTVTLAELESGYQKDADYRRQTGVLAEARREAEQIYQTNMQNFEREHTFAAAVQGNAEQLIAAELNDPRLAHLRESDPAEWTARREEIGQRIAQLRNTRQQAAQQYETFRNDQRTQLKQREGQALLGKMPDFSQQHIQLARHTMQSIGYEPSEIAEVFDHRQVLGALELAALRAEVEILRGEKTKAADTVKRVKKNVPKLLKPGKGQRLQSRGGVKRSNVQKLKERARKSGRVEDAAQVIESMME